MKKTNPFVLTMPKNHCWSIGECVRHAWRDRTAWEAQDRRNENR